MKKLEPLKAVINNIKLKNVFKPENIKAGGASFIRSLHEYKAIYEYFGNNNIEQAKQEFFQCGMLDLLDVEKNEIGFPSFTVFKIGFPLLSDSSEMLEKYQALRFHFDEKLINNGFLTIFPDTVLKFLASDYSGVSHNLKIMEEKIIIKKSAKRSIITYDYYKALLDKDKDKVVEIIYRFLSPKEHNYRNKHQDILKEFVSQPTIGYTKLAWLQGMEIEIDSPYIPMDLMPIKPNTTYVDAYPALWDI
jgi:predicted transcriptional regulator